MREVPGCNTFLSRPRSLVVTMAWCQGRAKRKVRNPKLNLQTAMVTALLLSTMALGSACSSEAGGSSDQCEAWLNEAWRIVAEDHYDPGLHGLDWPAIGRAYREQLRTAGPGRGTEIVNAMLQELNDSHCGFGLPVDLAGVASPYVFSAGDVGLDVRLVDGQAVVTTVDRESPAAAAGVLPGFVVQMVDGEAIEEIIDEAAVRAPHNEANRLFHRTEGVLRRLYGEPGTTVDLVFLDGDDCHRSVELRRVQRPGGLILDPTLPEIFVEVESRRLESGICHLRFSAFRPEVTEKVLSAIDQCPTWAPMLLDLRGNNGGSAEATSRVLSRFVKRTSLVYTRVGRDDQIPVFVEPAASRHEGPVVIVVDELSISAAENMAETMRQLNLARVVGRRTPGQVLWGEGRALGGGAMVFIPTAKLVYPDGSHLEGRGVTPDMSIALNRKDLLDGVDPQIRAAVDLLRSMREVDSASTNGDG